MYSPTILDVGLLFFLRLCYTIAMPEKTALVTGASSGFGLLISIELAKAGFRVVATMRNLGCRERLDQAIAATGVAATIEVRALDVTIFDTIQSFVDGVVRDYGRLDVLVNNAGFAVAGFAEDIKVDELRLQFETNFFGAVAMTKAALPTIRRQRSGHIIHVSSISGLHGAVTASSYSASKHALEGWSESLRMEVNSLGIKVVLVEPGAFKTDIGRAGLSWESRLRSRRRPIFNVVRACGNASRKFPRPTRSPAQLVVAIAQNPNPKLCYLVGRDAKIQLAMKRILPWKCKRRLVSSFIKID